MCMSKIFQLEVPISLDGITLAQYQEFLDISKSIKEGDVETSNLKALEIFCGASLEDLRKIPMNEFNAIVGHINSLFKEETPLQRDVTIVGSDGKGIAFGFIPKLDDITMGEFVDLDKYISDWDNMHRAMNILYRPITFRKGDLYTIEEYSASDRHLDLMKEMPVSVALGATVFFYRLGKELSSCTMDFLQKQLQNKEHPMYKDLEKSGVGINQFMHSLKEMSDTLKKLPSYLSNNVFSG